LTAHLASRRLLVGLTRTDRLLDVEANHRTHANDTVEVERLALNGCAFRFLDSIRNGRQENLGFRFRCRDAGVLAFEPTSFGSSIVRQLRTRFRDNALQAFVPVDFNELDFRNIIRARIGTGALNDEARDSKADHNCDL